MSRVIVTGSRRWPSPGIVRGALEDLAFDRRILPPDQEPLVVVHGACPTRADAAAHWWAMECRVLGVTVEPHPADWDRHGLAAGPIRNLEMVEAGADLVLAFPLGQSRGTQHCIKAAREAGIPVRIVTLEDR